MPMMWLVMVRLRSPPTTDIARPNTGNKTKSKKEPLPRSPLRGDLEGLTVKYYNMTTDQIKDLRGRVEALRRYL